MAPSSWMLVPRSITGDIQNVPQTFSSWHNCMQKTYCKWPAIVGIIVASLVVLSIVWCCARCLCCGLSCCCQCFSCCDSCGGRRKSPRSKHADGAPVFAPYQGYQPAPNPPAYEPPRFATFDAPSKNNKIHEDSLPAMPSWENAASRRVEDTSAQDDMEMGNLATGVGAPVAHANGLRYTQIPNQPASPSGFGPGEYRGANMTHPYGSDLGAQRLAIEDTGYHRYGSDAPAGRPYAQGPSYNEQAVSPSHGGSSPYWSQPGYLQQQSQTQHDGFAASSPAPTYQTYAPTQSYSPTDSTRYAPTTVLGKVDVSSSQTRPPSLLQVGRKPLPGSGREV